MNTSKWLPVSIALALGLVAPSVATAVDHASLRVLLATHSVGAGNKSKAALDRQESESLLVRARKAIKEGKLDAADGLLSQAEKLKVEYSVLHFGDTPKKLRAELTAAKRSGKRDALQRPSQKFTPEAPEDQHDVAPAASAGQSPVREAAPPKVPAASLDPRNEEPLVLPQSEGKVPELPGSQRPQTSPEDDANLTTRIPSPVRESPVAANGPQLRQQSDSHLLSARRALAVGDVRRATAAVQSARQLGVNYGYHDDTPDKADASITSYRQVMEQLNAKQDNEAARHQLADLLMDQAQQLSRWKDYDEAERLALSVKNLKVNYGPFEAKPDAVLEKIAASRRQNAGGAVSAAAQSGPATTAPGRAKPIAAVAGAKPQGGAPYPTTQASYETDEDTARNVTAGAQEGPPAPSDEDNAEPAEPTVPSADAEPTGPVERLPSPSEEPKPIVPAGPSAENLLRQGEEALQKRDMKTATKYFREAYRFREQLDPAAAQRLQDHLQLHAAPTGPKPGGGAESLIEGTSAKQQLLAKQISAEVAQKQTAAGKIREKNPKRAMELLKEARTNVEAAGLDPQSRAQLLRRVDRSIADLDKYLVENRAQIELDDANKEVLKDVDRRREARIEIDDKLARLVDDFNKLMDQQRWQEAEVLAKRARELDPENPLVKQLIWQSRFVSRERRNQNLKEDKEKGVWETLDSVEQAAIPFDDRDPIKYMDAKDWDTLTKTRKSRQMAENRGHKTERELDIERKLKTPVSLKFRNRPLSEVLDQLAKLANVNLHLDEKGLEEEGISSDTSVTIDLTSEISLKSALNLILEPKHLGYVITDEVLKITSEQLRDGKVFSKTYNVADLVIPIPNFAPNGRMGLAGALSDAYSMSGGTMGAPGTAYLASHDGTQATGVVHPSVLAQINQLMPGGSRPGMPGNMSVPAGPGGVGGGNSADFDTLIDLITTTVKPQTWDEVGGPGSVQRFPNNLSLVISQTQDVHEEIVDLLEQLRRNQDLQVTIEVRFITLNDNFFEQIGVDFQANIVNTNAGKDPNGAGNKKEIVGLLPPVTTFPNFTSNLDIPFRQTSFNLAAPQFGQPANVASFGFAILSDLEAYLLINASQGDRRSNVLQAPKVTMFNGQQASVFDTTQTPFVISVIPVVGDFAAAYQPVITVLSEGTSLTVQSVISNDRRFVRLTVIPFFSQIGDVKEFTFSGTKTTTSKTSDSKASGGTSGDSTASSNDAATTSDGITLQLPNFSIVTVNTTVSVPDGGTVLLGGIKRLSEGRNEFGVPILSKLPYINRLFKNVGIGRETQSLMMMVTPRIIIQEEEEERLGIQAPP